MSKIKGTIGFRRDMLHLFDTSGRVHNLAVQGPRSACSHVRQIVKDAGLVEADIVSVSGNKGHRVGMIGIAGHPFRVGSISGITNNKMNTFFELAQRKRSQKGFETLVVEWAAGLGKVPSVHAFFNLLTPMQKDSFNVLRTKRGWDK